MKRNLFEGLSKRQVAKIYNAGVLRPMQKDDIIFRKGDIGTELFIIINGKTTVLAEHDGHLKAVAELARGDCFGEMALFSHAERSATVLCTEGGTLLVLDEERLTHLVEKKISAKFLVNLIAILATRLLYTNAYYMKAQYGNKQQWVVGPPSLHEEQVLDKRAAE